ncbi:group II truncated hemoglobin [Chitinophagaceae bacterium LB-8]|uniref:Group II truncated hemoglobin n=1 Tax=Paraflavisolibacter caeni TaxID=2982496 RepID=A0A9X2Y1L0_9BACT|nr:group II truncated hemoglobin [Paraflavisolibacter caeni]MCU7552927.1 group II truncated hemoglobin [Paraflavisolibacter caeni]
MDQPLTKKVTPTLFEWMGGQEVFEKLFTAFYQKVLNDDLLSPLFKNMPSEHVQRVSHFVAEVFGGPKVYSTADKGSHAMMISKHIGKMLTEEKRQRWIQLLLQAADEIGLKDDPEFRSAFVGYIEWGTRIAVINSQLPKNPMEAHTPMPKWGWGETGGPYIPNEK